MAHHGGNSKMPPVLESEDNYMEWTHDLKIWQLFTDLPKERQGPAVYLNLSGKAKECVRDLTPEQVGHENGVETITAKLDAIFKKDQNTRAYMAFKEFYDLKREPGVSISEFIVRFEYLYHKLQQFEMKLPEGVKAFFLLNAANVSEENEKLARATVGDLTYDNMKSKIQKIFGDPNANESTSCKIEPVYYTSGKRGNHWRGRAGRDRGSRGGRGRGRFESRSYKHDTKCDENPVGPDGKPMRCFNCESIKHLSYECPHKDSKNITKRKDNESVHLALFADDEQRPQSLQESIGMALLDSGCTKTVTGKVWFDSYIDSLTESDRKEVEYSTDSSKFRFGDGKEVVSQESAKIPAYLANKKVMINTSIVDSGIPLLLSRPAMKKAEMTVDFEKDTAFVLGSEVELITSSSGHYCLPISKCILNDKIETKIVLHATGVKELTYVEKKAKARKLHRQFAHASKEKLTKLVKESKDFDDTDFLKAIAEICEECETCETFKKPPLKPVVGLRLANEFNELVCMDLKEVKHNTWILHLIDAATRYSAACLVKTKAQGEIVRQIFSMWISYFGAPKSMLSDNGGEFANETFREMNEKLNVSTLSTAAESPWSNGTVERHNAILYESMMKTLKDTNCEPEIALAWAVSAKNALQNNGGYSPNQLVFGRNINLPSVLTDDMPALDSFTKSDLIRMNLDAMHRARENFIQAESSERIRRALRHKVRTYSDEKYENGEKVFYKRKNIKGWKGPGVVLGQDGQFVCIRHASAFFRVHPCQLMKTKISEETSTPGTIMKEDEKTKPNLKCHEMVKNDDFDSESESDQGNQENNTEQQEENTGQTEANVEQDDNNIIDKPKRNTFIKFKMKGSEWQKAKVLSYQPKQTGKYKDWINVHAENEPEPKCIDWEEVESWTNVDNESLVFLGTCQNMAQEVIDAKHKEIQNMKENNVFVEIEHTNQTPVITARWVITEKVKNDEQIVKARLVAQGYEEDSSQFKKDSPTCTRESLRLLFMTASLMKWELNTLDITAAFLQGNEMERELYLKPPNDVCPKGYIWKLKRCIYGLTDAPRSWYNKVKETLYEMGATMSIYDSSLFLFHSKSKSLSGMMAVHVDDFAYCGTEEFHRNVIEEIKRKFKINTVESGMFKYVGLQVTQTKDTINVNQNTYIQNIESIKWAQSRELLKGAELLIEEKKQLKCLGGQMLWVASQTRPDLSFETCSMTNISNNSTTKAIHEANKAVVKLKASSTQIKFPSIESIEDVKVKAFSDATYASLDDGSSHGGHIIFIEGRNKKVVPISWQSKKLNRVTKSPLASETLELAEAADAGVLVALMVQEIFQLKAPPIVQCFTDNKSLHATLKSTTTLSDKRLRIDIARLRQMVERKEIDVTWVEGNRQIADSLTKRGASSQRLLEVLETSHL